MIPYTALTYINLGFLKIPTYGVIVAVAFLLCGWLTARKAEKTGASKEVVWDLFFWLLIGAIVGMRIGYVAINLDYFLSEPLEILKIWHGGAAFFGGLFGAFLSLDPDPISFWHSNFREFPGQNLALYNNKTADNLLEEARQTLNPVDRYRLYDEFQRIIIEDIPAVFLYSPHNLYGIDKDIKGFKTSIIATPSERFTNARSWYIDTSRDYKSSRER